jgi:hypothetical protein
VYSDISLAAPLRAEFVTLENVCPFFLWIAVSCEQERCKVQAKQKLNKIERFVDRIAQSFTLYFSVYKGAQGPTKDQLGMFFLHLHF